MNKVKTINIHGKAYVPVSERLKQSHAEEKLQGVKTEVLLHEPVVVIRATVNIAGIEYQGISSANPAKSIEKSNPYEVAETSAVGRALAFAGYEIDGGIASAEEMQKSSYEPEVTREVNPDECEHTDFWINEVKKEGPNKGKKFKSCKSCKKFLGWHTEEKIDGSDYEA